MFKSHKCGLCKVPQETQSPVTKLFRRLGCSESSSETVNLVKTKKKKSSPCVAPSKPQKCDCTETGMQTNNSNNKPAKNADDTFSFTSCSLKKLLASESPKLMMALIVAVGTLTVILVLKCICCPAIISELTETRERRSNDAVNEIERKPWEASKSKLMSEISELTGKDTRETNLHSGGEDYPEYLSPDLSSILDPVKVNEGYSSNNLRDFYRKLLKTDIQIKNLKKGFANTNRGNIDSTDPNTRLKRSLKIFSGPRRNTETSSNKGNFNKYPLSDDLKKAKDILKNKENSGGSNDLEKEKSLTKEEKLQSERESKDKGNNNVYFKLLKTEDLTKAKNKMKPYSKYTQWLDEIFRRESPATRHRRLLQHDDDEDDADQGATEDYEEQTKEPWEREKRTAKSTQFKTLEIYVQTEKNIASETKHPKSKTSKISKPILSLKPSTPQYSQEINYLIDAAMKMKPSNIDDKKHKESKPHFEEDLKGNGNYDELVALAQAYSDYGVLDNKKEIIENNMAPGNTNSIQSDKSHKTVWFNFDNQHGQRIKLKSNDGSKAEKDTFLKKLDLNKFSKMFHSEIKNNKIKATKTSNTVDKISSTIATITSRIKSTLKVNQKHKERNVIFCGHRRSLKSVETGEPNDEIAPSTSDIKPYGNHSDQLQYNEENNEKNNLKYTSNIESTHDPFNAINKIKNNTIAFIAHEQKASKLIEVDKHNNSTSWGLSEIFSMLADLCMFLAGFDANQDNNGYRFLYDFVTMLNPNYSRNETLSEKVPNDTRSIETSIDTERVENIGHRSRVLLSFEEPAENFTSTTYEIDVNKSYVATSKKLMYDMLN